MGQRLGRQSSSNLTFDRVDQHQLPPIVQHPPCVSDGPANASRQSITPSITQPSTAAVIIKIQLLKMESNNLNGNGNNNLPKTIVDQTTTTTSLVGAYEQLALRPPADVTVAAPVMPPITNNSTEYVPMTASPRTNNNQSNGNDLNRNNNLVRSLTDSSESDNTISNSNNSICSSSNNNAAGTLNIVCDSNKINNLSKVSQASQPQQQHQLQQQHQQQQQRNFNITTSEPNREIYTMMYAANSGGTSGGTAQQIVQDEELTSAVDTRNSCNHCSRRRTLAALARRPRVCKLCHESLDDSTGSGKAKEKAGGKEKDGAKPKKGNWGIKFNCAKLRGNSSKASTSAAAPAPPSPPASTSSSDCLTSPSYTNLLTPAEAARTFDSCVCTGYRKVDDSESERSESEYDVRPQHVTTTRTSVSLFSTTTTMGPEGTTSRTSTIVLPDHRTTTSIPANFVATAPTATSLTVATMSCNGQVIQRFERTDHYGNSPSLGTNNVILVSVNPPMIDVTKFNADEYPIEDCDEQARRQRAYEIAEGVEPPPGFTPSPTSTILLNPSTMNTTGQLSCAPTLAYNSPVNVTQWCTPDAFQEFMNLQMPNSGVVGGGNTTTTRIHSQVDYIHCLVPDLQKITGCCFYWGKMDRYEAEKLLEGKPEGTFLLRDSAQEDFLFSVSFRKYGRSLHARIEQFNHKFSFDSHDPGVYTASTVTGLLEHYKDPSCVMFFEPMLTLPLNRNFCFSLQQLCRATIVSHITYDGINDLCLPQRLRSYLQEYHYKQRLRVKKFDDVGIYAKTS